jgi:ligand-binding sensor domain-containing protein
VPPNGLTLDAAGNLWCAHPEAGVVAIAGNKRHDLAWPPKVEGLRMGNRSLTLLPLAKGPLVLAVHSSGRTATLALRPKGIVIEAEQNLRFSPSSQRHPLRDSRGWLWLSGTGSSIALDKNGQAITNHAGQALLEDKRKAVWFVKDATAPQSTITRWLPAAPETTLRIPGLTGHGALAPDGTVWLLAHGHGLVRVGMKNNTLKVLEKWPVPMTSTMEVWCDDTGRVWCWEPQTSYQNRLLCYPMRSQAE